MGFWHTGYIEFHEPRGLEDVRLEPSPPEFPCKHCNQIYGSANELRQHRFESHPLYRPTLFIQGRELGTHPVRVTRGLSTDDVKVDGCERAFLNGNEIPVQAIPRMLALISSDVCQLELRKADVSATFTLDFRIALKKDLIAVEMQFIRTALGRRLDYRAVEEFISATSGFRSAIGYCDGICSYLYGILAKEGSSESSLPYEAYVGKFNKAVEELSVYDRPLARMIGSLVAFHFNHFEEAEKLAHRARVGQAATRYTSWMRGETRGQDNAPVSSVEPSKLEALVTDWETERIIRWTVRPLDELSEDISEMESFLNQQIEEYDSVKVHVLLGEIYVRYGDVANALKHAKALRNLVAMEKWAESMIRVLGGSQ